MHPLTPDVALAPALLVGGAAGLLAVTVWVARVPRERAVATVLWLAGALVAVPAGAAAGAGVAVWWSQLDTPPEVVLARQLVADCSQVVDVDPQVALQVASRAVRGGTGQRVAGMAAGVDATPAAVPEVVADDTAVTWELADQAQARRASARHWCRRWFAGP